MGGAETTPTTRRSDRAWRDSVERIGVRARSDRARLGHVGEVAEPGPRHREAPCEPGIDIVGDDDLASEHVGADLRPGAVSGAAASKKDALGANARGLPGAFEHLRLSSATPSITARAMSAGP